MKRTPPNISDLVVRPVREDDLDGVYQLAAGALDPITTLPPDREFLEKKIRSSLRAFSPYVDGPGSESYFFVLEDLVSDRLLGCGAVFARVGGFEPFYTYEIKESQFAHADLGIEKSIKELHLKLDHDGPSEIGSLYLDRSTRGLGLGWLVSVARFLFVANFRERFAEQMLVELRGYCRPDGSSPFWNAVGKHFFGCDYMTADQHSAKAAKSFIRDLMPQHPIYLPLLPKKARKAVGEVHPNTRAARKMLEDEGFRFIDEVDIFDAGPAYRCDTDAIFSIASSRVLKVLEVVENEQHVDGQRLLLANLELDFRCCMTEAVILEQSHQKEMDEVEDEQLGLRLSKASCNLLKVELGDSLRIVKRGK